jgi:hypothetical protein
VRRDRRGCADQDRLQILLEPVDRDVADGRISGWNPHHVSGTAALVARAARAAAAIQAERLRATPSMARFRSGAPTWSSSAVSAAMAAREGVPPAALQPGKMGFARQRMR